MSKTKEYFTADEKEILELVADEQERRTLERLMHDLEDAPISEEFKEVVVDNFRMILRNIQKSR